MEHHTEEVVEDQAQVCFRSKLDTPVKGYDYAIKNDRGEIVALESNQGEPILLTQMEIYIRIGYTFESAKIIGFCESVQTEVDDEEFMVTFLVDGVSGKQVYTAPLRLIEIGLNEPKILH